MFVFANLCIYTCLRYVFWYMDFSHCVVDCWLGVGCYWFGLVLLVFGFNFAVLFGIVTGDPVMFCVLRLLQHCYVIYPHNVYTSHVDMVCWVCRLLTINKCNHADIILCFFLCHDIPWYCTMQIIAPPWLGPWLLGFWVLLCVAVCPIC